MTQIDTAALARDYEKLPSRLGLPPLVPMRLAVLPRESVAESRAAELFECLREYEAGWIAFRSGIDWFSPERLLSEDALGLGPVLAAELFAGEKSLQIQFDGAAGSGWNLVEFREGGSDGLEYLAQDLIMLSETWTEAGVNLSYRRYWGLDTDGAMRPLHARFTGFAKNGT